MRFLISVALALAALLVGHSPAVVHAAIVSGVSGDNTNDAYVGTGGLLLPTSFTGGGSKSKAVASCLGCTWKYSIYCDVNNTTGLCTHAVATCPAGQIRYRVWFGQTPAAVSVIGSVCWGAGRPPTRRTVEAEIHDVAIRYVPKLSAAIQPRNGTLTSIPIIARTGQPTTFKPPAMTLAGRRVTIAATAKWHWSWGDGFQEWKAVPGAAYPSKQITHQYRKVGTYEIQVQTIWSAQFTIAGLGTYPVQGEIVTQEATLSLPVRTTDVALIPWE